MEKITMDVLSKLIGAGSPRPVALSKFHSGQAVYPVVLACDLYPRYTRVVLSWFDASDQTYSQPREFQGTTRKCEDWLTSEGVHLDSQGIH